MAIIFALFIFAMFADYAAQADYQNRVNNRSNSKIDYINMKVAGAFFMSLVVIPMIFIEGGVCKTCEKGPMEVVCKFFPWIFAFFFVVGGFFYWVGGCMHVDELRKKQINDDAFFWFTLPSYVLFQVLVITADFLKDVLADKKWRTVILNAGLFVFSLFVFCALADDYGSRTSSVYREGREVAVAGCFFMWFAAMFVILFQFVSIPQLEAFKKWVDIVLAVFIIFGGFLFMCGLFTISAEHSRSARNTNNKDFRDIQTTWAFFWAVWGMFIIAQAIIVGYDILAEYQLFPCCSVASGDGAGSSETGGDKKQTSTATGGSAAGGPPPPPQNNNNQYGNDGSGDAAPPAPPPANTAYAGSPSMDEGRNPDAPPDHTAY